MANMQVSIGLRRESGADNRAVDGSVLGNELVGIDGGGELSGSQAITRGSSFGVVSISHCVVLDQR